MNQHPSQIHDCADSVRLIKRIVENFKTCQKVCLNEYDQLHEEVEGDLLTLACVLRDILSRAKLLTEEQRKTLDKLTDGDEDEVDVDDKSSPNTYPYKKCCKCGERKSCGNYVEDNWFCEDCAPQ